MKFCNVINLGLIDYKSALEFQRQLFNKKHATRCCDYLIFAEHFPVYTCGRSAEASSLIKGDLKGIDVVEVDRGGSITFHGPGQLMVYPIITLPNKTNLLSYIKDLEFMIIRTAAVYGIKANSGTCSGVWVDTKKLSSVGIKVSSAITMHGLSLNVNCDLTYFDPIKACGLQAEATSMEKILGYEVEINDLIELIILNFGKIFNYKMKMYSERKENEPQLKAPSKNAQSN